jgi:hypothetical protein
LGYGIHKDSTLCRGKVFTGAMGLLESGAGGLAVLTQKKLSREAEQKKVRTMIAFPGLVALLRSTFRQSYEFVPWNLYVVLNLSASLIGRCGRSAMRG